MLKLFSCSIKKTPKAVRSLRDLKRLGVISRVARLPTRQVVTVTDHATGIETVWISTRFARLTLHSSDLHAKTGKGPQPVCDLGWAVSRRMRYVRLLPPKADPTRAFELLV